MGLHPNDESELPAPSWTAKADRGREAYQDDFGSPPGGHKLAPSPASIAFSCRFSSPSSKKARSPIALIKNQYTSVVPSNQSKWLKQVREPSPHIYTYT